MPQYIQGTKDGPLHIISCVCCKTDRRGPNLDDLKVAWKREGGTFGNFNGHFEFICDDCLEEGHGKPHKTFWRW